jgi:ABC-type Fe3+/spermidine/putrescine transport system ATPase subunit
MAHRIGVMAVGRIAQAGSPVEFYERPASRFVAEFLGAANILAGEVGPDGTVHLPRLGVTVRIGRPATPGAALLAVRPERMRLGRGTNRLEGELTERAYAGGSVTYGVRLADGSLVRVADTLVEGFAPTAFPPGLRVVVGWEPESCILLPPG